MEFLKGRFVELIIAPGFEEDALTFLKNKSKDLRLLELPIDNRELLRTLTITYQEACSFSRGIGDCMKNGMLSHRPHS